MEIGVENRHVNPARAGMIPLSTPFTPMHACKPRASGDDPTVYVNDKGQFAVNPARAGMILIELREPLQRSRKPRASGDDPPPPPIAKLWCA